jgi:hypothetical protein
MIRRKACHQTRLAVSAGDAAAGEFRPGDRVRTVDGLAGRIQFVTQAFAPGTEAYQVVLDSGLGGGTYLASQLRPVPDDYRMLGQQPVNLPAGVTASLEAEAGLEPHTADIDYPEMGSVLQDRPDPGSQIKVVGAATEGHGLDPFGMAMHGLEGEDAAYMRDVIEHIRQRKGPSVPINQQDADTIRRSMHGISRMEGAGYQVSAHTGRYPRGFGIDLPHNHTLHLVPEDDSWYARISHKEYPMGPRIEHSIHTPDEELPQAVRTFLGHPPIQAEMEHQRTEGQRVHEEIRREGSSCNRPSRGYTEPDEGGFSWPLHRDEYGDEDIDESSAPHCSHCDEWHWPEDGHAPEVQAQMDHERQHAEDLANGIYDRTRYCGPACQEGHEEDMAHGIGGHHTFSVGEPEWADEPHPLDRDMWQGEYHGEGHAEPQHRRDSGYEVRSPAAEGRCHYCRARLPGRLGSRHATTFPGGQQIDHHGDAPEHGTRPRAENPDSYDGESSEGEGDPVFNSPMTEQEKHKDAINGAQVGMYPEGMSAGDGPALQIMSSTRDEKGDRWHEYQGRYQPGILHRGIHVRLPGHLHDYVHDESEPAHERAHALASHFSESGLGMHWTPHINIAHRALNNAAGKSDPWDDEEDPGYNIDDWMEDHHGEEDEEEYQEPEPTHTSVIFHGSTGERNRLRNPGQLEEHEIGWAHSHDESEFPVKPGSPMRLHGISWKLHEPEYPNDPYEHVDFAKPMRHTARVPWTDHLRTELRSWQDGAPGLPPGGDFVPRSEFTNRHPLDYEEPEELMAEAHYAPYEPPEEHETDSEYAPMLDENGEYEKGELATSFFPLPEDVATPEQHINPELRHRVMHSLSLLREARSENSWATHMMYSHGWAPGDVQRVRDKGNRVSDIHAALHETGLAGHSHDEEGAPAELSEQELEARADQHWRTLRHKLELNNRFGPDIDLDSGLGRVMRSPAPGGRKISDPYGTVMRSAPAEPREIQEMREGRPLPSWRLSSHTEGPRAFVAHVAERTKADEIYARLAGEYDHKSLGWVHDAAWGDGPEDVDPADIDYSGEEDWQASGDKGKVKKFRKQLRKGRDVGEAVLVQTPGSTSRKVADGRHRALAAREEGVPLKAWTGHVSTPDGPWDTMDSAKFGQGEQAPLPDDSEANDLEAPAEEEQGPAGGEDSLDLGPPAVTRGGPPLTQGGTPSTQQGPHWQQDGAGDALEDSEDAPPWAEDDQESPEEKSSPGKDSKTAPPSSPQSGKGKAKNPGKTPSSAPPDGKKKLPPKAALKMFRLAATDPAFRFEFTASWRDVVAKAKRLREGGRVRITAVAHSMVIGEVGGDHDVYESGIQRVPGKPNSIMAYACGCPWASFHQDKDYPGRLNGRPCSHAYAVHLEVQARRMFGKELRPDPADTLPAREVVVKSMPPWTSGGWAQTWTAPSTWRPFVAAFGQDESQWSQWNDNARGQYHVPALEPPAHEHHGEGEACTTCGRDHRSPASLAAHALLAAGEDPAAVDVLCRTAGMVALEAAAQDDAWLRRHVDARHPEIAWRHPPIMQRAHEDIHANTASDIIGHQHTPWDRHFNPDEESPYKYPDEHGGHYYNAPTHEIEENTDLYEPGTGISLHMPAGWPLHTESSVHDAAANDPWGDNNLVAKEPQTYPYGATEPPNKDMDPGSYGPLAGPDPENWGEIDQNSLTQSSGIGGQEASLHGAYTPWHQQGPSTWDAIGERHPHLYGDPDVHGEEAEGADGEGIGWAANHLANDRPEDPDAENSGSWDLMFHHEFVNPKNIDYARTEDGKWDSRVQHAYRGYKSANPDVVPPLVLVHRHGIYQVADGHHRAEAADLAHRPVVPAYVAYSQHPDEPFSASQGEPPRKAPFHGAIPHPGIAEHRDFFRREAGATDVMSSPVYIPESLSQPEGMHDWLPDTYTGPPYSDRANLAGPSTSSNARDPNGIRMEESLTGDIPYERWRSMPRHHQSAIMATDTRNDMHQELAARGHDMHWEHGEGWAQKGHAQFWDGTCRNCGAGATAGDGWSSCHSIGRDARREPCAGPGTAWQNDMLVEHRRDKINRAVSDFGQAMKDNYDRQWLKEQGIEAALQSELHPRPEPALPETTGDESETATGAHLPEPGVYPLSAPATGGGPGLSPHDEDLSPESPSIQTVGTQQAGGSDSDLGDITFQGRGQELPQESGDDPVLRFQSSAAARLYQDASPPGDSDIAAAARAFLKTAEVLPEAEAQELIREGRGRRARNLDLLALDGTHYLEQDEDLRRRGINLDEYDDDVISI